VVDETGPGAVHLAARHYSRTRVERGLAAPCKVIIVLLLEVTRPFTMVTSLVQVFIILFKMHDIVNGVNQHSIAACVLKYQGQSVNEILEG